MTNVDFVKRVQAIAATNPTYRTGGDGSDGTCDCIGLVMGALGHAFPMHSTNYFARYELAVEPQRITDGTEVQLGDLVFKACSESNPRYDLHQRYKPGGRYYINGELLDYYHVGVVTGTEPFVIAHCTQSGKVNGMAHDYSMEEWTHVGIVEELEYAGDEAEEETVEVKVMMVYAENKKPVNVRKRPNADSPKIAEIPVGTLVVVNEKTSEWAQITHMSYTGYMMAKFLKEPEEEERTVALTVPLSVARTLYQELQKILI